MDNLLYIFLGTIALGAVFAYWKDRREEKRQTRSTITEKKKRKS